MNIFAKNIFFLWEGKSNEYTIILMAPDYFIRHLYFFQKISYLCPRIINLSLLLVINVMKDFVNEVDAFLFQEKGVHISDLDFMEMPKERERYNFSKVRGSVNLAIGRFITKEEADAKIENFLNMTLP